MGVPWDQPGANPMGDIREALARAKRGPKKPAADAVVVWDWNKRLWVETTLGERDGWSLIGYLSDGRPMFLPDDDPAAGGE